MVLWRLLKANIIANIAPAEDDVDEVESSTT